MSKHEEIYEEIAAQYKGKRRIAGLQELVALSKDIGFTILDEDSLRKIFKISCGEWFKSDPLYSISYMGVSIREIRNLYWWLSFYYDGVFLSLIPYG